MSKALSRPSFLALSCVGAMAFASSAQAQDNAQGPRLGGMTVTDTAIDESPVKVEKAESPKYTRPLLDTPQTITVIGNGSLPVTASAWPYIGELSMTEPPAANNAVSTSCSRALEPFGFASLVRRPSESQ